jgi:hypothetical protein
MSVDVQKDNLPPPRVTTVMNIGRGRATGTRSRKKRQTTTDRAYAAEHSGTTGRRERGERAGRTRGREEQGEEKGCITITRM